MVNSLFGLTVAQMAGNEITIRHQKVPYDFWATGPGIICLLFIVIIGIMLLIAWSTLLMCLSESHGFAGLLLGIVFPVWLPLAIATAPIWITLTYVICKIRRSGKSYCKDEHSGCFWCE